MYPRFSLSILLSVFILSLFAPISAIADPLNEAAQMLPERVGDFRARGAATQPKQDALSFSGSTEDFAPLTFAARLYASTAGETFHVTLFKTRSDSHAYALLTTAASQLRQSKEQPAVSRINDVGTAGFASSDRLMFFKGAMFVIVTRKPSSRDIESGLTDFARLFAETIDKGEGEIPVLIKHLPEWERVQDEAIYAVSLRALQDAVGNRPVLDALNFEGGTEAVTALYDQSRLVIVEYNTPQIAGDADARILSRIKELRDGGQPVPSAYRRVGNYAVFVFDAPDEQQAGQLIDKVSYEQVVQWLGINPHALERAEREYRRTTAGVILAVLKASGLSLLLCLAVGGIFGAIVFKRRRARQALTAAYSDAGGIVRLNLDDLTPETNPAKLLSGGER